MRNLSRTILVFVFLSLIPSVGCAHYSGGPWTGKVIDAETKQPIKGAVVVAEWDESYAAIPETAYRLKDVKEVLTNSEGQFKIDAQTYYSVLPDSRIAGPHFTIFKPGYGYFPSQHVSPKDWKNDFFEKSDAVVELPKYRTIEERREKLNGGLISGLHRVMKLKLFREQVNIERLETGYKPLLNY